MTKPTTETLETSGAASLAFSPVSQPELKPLTPREYDRSILLMLGLDQNIGKTTLPSVGAAPFDNDISEHLISKVHVESFEFAATKVADAFLTSSTRANFIPCTATGAADRGCLERFTVQLASLAYRRIVTASEMKEVVDLAASSATQENQFDAGLKMAIQFVLQDPSFLYRFEVGVAKGADYELAPVEFLTKATFFLHGAPPTLQQIKNATEGGLSTAAAKEALIQSLLDDPKVIDQMDLFHSMWMGYSELGGQSQSATDFRTETKALVGKVLQDGLPWRTIMTSNQTFANPALAKLYDLDDQTTTGWKWRAYKGELRQGLLSQGSFLSVGVKFGDTSTTRRGYNIQKALFCGQISRPPTTDENGVPINIDEPPPSTVVYNCKEDLYRNTVLARKNCASCHSMMDTIAFGLENFAADASYRTTEPNKPNCTIRGEGQAFAVGPTGIVPLGTFTGPKQLADIALESGYLEKCLATRLIQFSIGRKPLPADEILINKTKSLNQKSSDFKSFLKSYILSPEFSTRKGS